MHHLKTCQNSRSITRSLRGHATLYILVLVAMLSMVLFLIAQVVAKPQASSDTAGAIVPVSNELQEPVDVVVVKEVRIATLLPFAADQLLAMGVQPVCVPGLRGRTPAAWEGIPTVQLDHSAGPNLEQLIAVQPDYIISGSVYAQFMPNVESITKAKVIMMDVESIQSVMDHMQTLGRIASRADEADKMIASLQKRLVPKVSMPESEEVSVLGIFGTPHSFYAFLPDSYLGDLVRHAGGRIGPEGLESHKIYRGLAPLSMETVIAFDPDVLFVLFHGPEESSRAMFEGDPLWSSLKAVSEDRMYFLQDDMYAMRPGSQLDLAMSQIHDYVQGANRELR